MLKLIHRAYLGWLLNLHKALEKDSKPEANTVLYCLIINRILKSLVRINGSF